MEEKAKILLLGTFHFKQKGGHLIDIDSGDITTDKRQRELKEVLEKLEAFKPNKIVVEGKQEKAKELSELFSQYCEKGSIESNNLLSFENEIVQIAFRLGKKLNHKYIYPVDVPVDLPDDVYQYAEKNCPRVFEKIMKKANDIGSYENELMQKHTVSEILKYINNPTVIDDEHSDLYLALNPIGAGEAYYGATMLTEWYRRNLYIFSNLQDLAKPGDRIFVLYGAGHCKILKSFIKDYSEFEFVDPLDYL